MHLKKICLFYWVSHAAELDFANAGEGGHTIERPRKSNNSTNLKTFSNSYKA